MTNSNTSPNAKRLLRRRILLWLLYAMDVTEGADAVALTNISRDVLVDIDYEISEALWDDTTEELRRIWTAHRDLDTRIQALSPRWKLERMATIDRNVLRLGAWEVMEQSDRPVVVINDCIDLAKQYGGKGSGAFINGLLDQLCKDLNLPMR